MSWFSKEQERPVPPDHSEAPAQHAAEQLASCIQAADTLIEKLEKAAETVGVGYASVEYANLRLQLTIAKLSYNNPTLFKTKEEVEDASKFLKESSAYVESKLREGKKWLSQKGVQVDA